MTTYRPRIIPCLLLSGKRLVKTRQFRDPVYVGDPINAVKIFNDFQADELVLLDIEATEKNLPISFELIRQIAEEAYMPLSYGGGIRHLDDIQRLVQSGVEKVILQNALENTPGLLTETATRFGSQAVVACLDVKRENGSYSSFTARGTKKNPVPVTDLARKYENEGAGELMLQFIDRDGTETGYDLDLVHEIAAHIHIPLIACGGAGSLEDLRAVTDSGASAAAAGSIFCFLGSRNSVMINYPDKKELNAIFTR